MPDDPPVDLVQPVDLQRFLYHLRTVRQLKPKTVRNAHIGLSAFATWLVAEGLIAVHWVHGRIKAPKVQEKEIAPLTRRDIQALLAACDRSALWESKRRLPAAAARPTRLRDRAIILFLLDTGVRAQELCDLLVGDVDMESGAAQVRRGKGDKGRTVYLGVIARAALWKYVKGRRFRDSQDALFATATDGPIERNALRKMLRAAGKRAEVTEPVTPHRFRHTFAITYLRNGGDVFTLQQMLGHATMEMVRRYLALAQEDMAAAHRRASPADNWRLG